MLWLSLSIFVILYCENDYLCVYNCFNTQRCIHKEASSDYRNMTGYLITELFVAAVLPAWPVTTVLLEQLTKRIVLQLNSSVSVADSRTLTAGPEGGGGGGGGKRDNALIVFLLDLVGTLSLHLRKVVLLVNQEVECANGLKPTWFSYITEQAVEGTTPRSTATTPTVGKKKGSGGKKGSKTSPTNSGGDSRSVSPFTEPRIETAKALAILSEISAFALDAVAEQPDSVRGDLAMIPPPFLLLSQIGDQDDLVR